MVHQQPFDTWYTIVNPFGIISPYCCCTSKACLPERALEEYGMTIEKLVELGYVIAEIDAPKEWKQAWL
jgi:hypothetical protein